MPDLHALKVGESRAGPRLCVMDTPGSARRYSDSAIAHRAHTPQRMLSERGNERRVNRETNALEYTQGWRS
jgi:hypothetical protein